jgi:hypothetical protein
LSRMDWDEAWSANQEPRTPSLAIWFMLSGVSFRIGAVEGERYIRFKFGAATLAACAGRHDSPRE